MKVEEVETLRSRLRARLPEESGGRITYGARAHAIKGLAAGVTKATRATAAIAPLKHNITEQVALSALC